MGLEGELHQVGVRAKSKIFHNPILVERDCTRCNVEGTGSLFHRLAFSKKLQHFTLARCQLAFASRSWIPDKLVFDALGYLRCDVGATLKYFLKSLLQLL